MELISEILYFDFLISSTALFISSLVLKKNLSILFSLSIARLEFNIFPFKVLKFTFNDQYSSGLNCSISCSLSVNNLRATDWTLPADFEPGSLVQSIGEILNPTR